MLGFIKGNAGGIVMKHQEIIRDNEIEFLTGPIPSFARFL
jgi:hypothetical protein